MRINALEDQETGFNGDVDDNDEVAAYSFIFVRDNFNLFKTGLKMQGIDFNDWKNMQTK